MKYFYTIVCIGMLWPAVCFTQDMAIDASSLKCMYNYTYMNDTLQQTVHEDLIVLEIGAATSKSYSYYTFQSDSLLKLSDGQEIRERLFNQSLEEFKKHRNRSRFLNSFPRRRTTTSVYKNYPKGKMTVTDAVGTDYVIYTDTLNAQRWVIADSLKTVLDYPCQMATCDFRGRHWTAWFAPDIPVGDGPWKFGGLPGLITEVYDKGNEYHFSIISMEKAGQKPIQFVSPADTKAKYKEINRRELLKIQMQRLRNTAGIMEAESGLSFGKTDPVYYDLIERDYR